MNRIRWLVVAVLVLTVANVGSRWWRNRGLITIHCEDWPASKVVREIEKQGGITIKTNVTDETKMRMHLDKVPLTEAMETFAVVSEGRWRLTYVFASGLGEIQTGINGLFSNERPEGWKRLSFRIPQLGDDPDNGPAPDPRADLWQVKAPEKNDFQSYAQQAARSVSAAIVFPEAWNPTVSKQPPSGPIRKSAQALAKASKGKVLEVFLVQKNERNDGPPGEDGDRGPRFGRGDRDTPVDDAERDRRRQEFQERFQAEIDKLPADKRAAAQQRFEERRKFFEGMRDLPEAERRAKMEEFFSSEQNQERMEARESERMARMTPDQRVDRARKYVERKQAARSGTTSR
jgi:hypothetical protein